MVMDATQSQQPSPQSVGREFVRQYYTLLNKAPNHLHRFYNNNSSFIHGESTLVIGQKNIHNRIQQLNFHDCHAKISQVDAQATLGNGVVVQVTGELSNDGQPMRRFTQTFVLAAQSPKKYYVHNDIFRYQDLYSDEENDVESRSENGEEHEQPQTVPIAGANANEQQTQIVAEQQQQQQIPAQVVAAAAGGTGVLSQQAQAVYYSMPTAGGRPLTVLSAPPGAAPVPLGATFGTAAAAVTAAAAGVPPQQQVQPNAAGVSQLNGVVAHEELISSMQQPPTGQQTLVVNQTPSSVVQQTTATVAVAANAVLGGQTPAGVATVPVANATAMPQNATVTIPGYQQSPLMQPHILQQQQQQQQPLSNTPSQQTLLQQSQTPLNSSANIVDVDDTLSSNTITISPSVPPSVQNDSIRTSTVVTGPAVVNVSVAETAPAPAPVVEDFKTINEQQQQEKYEAAKQQQQNEPKTYANLFKSNSSSPSSFVNATMQQQQIQQQQHQQQQTSNSIYQTSSTISSGSYSQSTGSSTSMSVYNNRNSDNATTMRTDNNTQAGGGPLPQRSNTTRINKDFEQRRTSNAQQFGDNQQLFLGNIPHHASEEELKSLFARFGNVLDLRILSKAGSKLPPGVRNPLNYGFITYEDPESVQNCLANCPLYFPENAPDGQKLNVEEKKPRARPSDMPPRQSMGGGSSMTNTMSSNQRNSMSSGGPPSRSLSNSGGGGGIMRGSSANNMSRGGGGGPRSGIGGAFNRNDNRSSGPSNTSGSQMRGGNSNAQSASSSYGVRR